ncbi:MAG: hypothetical protein JWP01_4269 [Myxococcales bacterium]|nr:hypothetical protein [Myxococcales bacterium]
MANELYRGGLVYALTGLLASCGGEPAMQSPDASRGTDGSIPVVTPTWLEGKPLNEWMQIPGTAGAGGTAVYAFCGMGLKQSSSEIIVALAGGHGDSADNRVSSIRIDQDQPSWTVRMQPSTEVEPNVAYYPDGKPSARHTYYTTHYVEQVDRLMMIGAQFVYGTPPSFPAVDGFDLETNTWDPAGTWADLTGGYGKTQDVATGDVWSATGYSISKWSAATRTQTVLQTFNSTFMAMQNAWDPVRNQLISLGFGDGWGYGNFPTMNAYIIDATGTTATPLTFHPSPALTQFLAAAPVSASFEYDPDHDRFFYFDAKGDGDHGTANDGGLIYVITPNATTTWDVSILPLGPGTQNPTRAGDVGINNRFRYVPALKGFVYLHAPAYNDLPDLYFIKTAQ